MEAFVSAFTSEAASTFGFAEETVCFVSCEMFFASCFAVDVVSLIAVFVPSIFTSPFTSALLLEPACIPLLPADDWFVEFSVALADTVLFVEVAVFTTVFETLVAAVAVVFTTDLAALVVACVALTTLFVLAATFTAALVLDVTLVTN